jgi:hypothetical protein
MRTPSSCGGVRALGLARHDGGNRLTTVPPINAEVGIGGKKDRVSQHFGHASQTGIGEAHRQVRVLLHER